MEEKPDKETVKATILKHAKLQRQYKGDYTGIREMRKHMSWYTTGYPHSAKLRQQINYLESFEELEEMIMNLFS